MRYLLTGKQMKDADNFTIKTIGIPSLVLMERAALEIVRVICEKQDHSKSVLVVCGSGNNGGDGYAIARLLHLKGYKVTICFVGKEESRSKENQVQKQICEYYQIPVLNVWDKEEYHIIVDAIFGTGLSREVTGIYADIIEKINGSSGWKVAVDIPSGINDTTGMVMGTAVKADLTVAIAFLKRGVVLQPGNAYAGALDLVDIGIQENAIINEKRMFAYEEHDLKRLFPRRKANSHKGTYGKVGLIVGSKGMSGAAFLCAKAAYMTGAGLVRIYTHEENRVILQKMLPEAMVTTYDKIDINEIVELISWSDVLGIGCGLGTSDIAEKILKIVLENGTKPLVIDADGLNLLAKNITLLDHYKNRIILTPHMKEMARLLNCSVLDLQEHRVEYLEAFVKEHPVTCVLKDARTLVANDDKNIYLNMSGNASMAKGGSGDVLTGVIAGLLPQMEDAFDAATLGVYLHGLAGDKAKSNLGIYSVMAGDIAEAVRDVLKEI